MNIFWKKLPGTEHLEKSFLEDRRIYREFLETEASETLKEYYELEAKVSSSEFQNKKKEVLGLKYKNTPEFAKEKWYTKTVKRKDICHFLELKDAPILLEYTEYKNSDEYIKIADKKARKEDATLEKFYRFERSRQYQDYIKLEGSSDIQKLFDVKAEIESEAFKNYKMFCENAKRWETTEEFVIEDRFLTLKNQDNIKQYLAYKSSSKFDFFKKWELIFEDSFSTSDLDKTKWITAPYWGDKQNIGAYSLINEAHGFTHDALVANGDTVKLFVKPIEVEGKAWNPELGFVSKTFSHQAAIINSGDLFQMRYGRVEAKIKMSGDAPIGHAFYLCSLDNKDQITVAKSISPKKYSLGLKHRIKKEVKSFESTVSGKKIFNYHIIALEWHEREISWFINGHKVHTETSHISDKPMYLAFSSFVTEGKRKATQGEMEIDWVRVYSEVK